MVIMKAIILIMVTMTMIMVLIMKTLFYDPLQGLSTVGSQKYKFRRKS